MSKILLATSFVATFCDIVAQLITAYYRILNPNLYPILSIIHFFNVMNVSSNFFFYMSLKPMRQAFLRGITFGGLKGTWNLISRNETGWFDLETRLKKSIYQKPLHVFLLSHNLFCKSYPYANFLTIKSSTNASRKMKLSFVFPVCVSTKLQTQETESIENQPKTIWWISVHAKRREECHESFRYKVHWKAWAKRKHLTTN